MLLTSVTMVQADVVCLTVLATLVFFLSYMQTSGSYFIMWYLKQHNSTNVTCYTVLFCSLLCLSNHVSHVFKVPLHHFSPDNGPYARTTHTKRFKWFKRICGINFLVIFSEVRIKFTRVFLQVFVQYHLLSHLSPTVLKSLWLNH